MSRETWGSICVCKKSAKSLRTGPDSIVQRPTSLASLFLFASGLEVVNGVGVPLGEARDVGVGAAAADEAEAAGRFKPRPSFDFGAIREPARSGSDSGGPTDSGRDGACWALEGAARVWDSALAEAAAFTACKIGKTVDREAGLRLFVSLTRASYPTLGIRKG